MVGWSVGRSETCLSFHICFLRVIFLKTRGYLVTCNHNFQYVLSDIEELIIFLKVKGIRLLVDQIKLYITFRIFCKIEIKYFQFDSF